ncbi:MAG: RIP metalloprotease RseP [Alphaproteobacteria bacterium]|nr:RIP metalloprotease RseP [Alphaproteobacteria bacterium]|tara:strand:+ start:17360 stop:18493 length:1134 start_codon:yes stop_codon:yes gene_type:complete
MEFLTGLWTYLVPFLFVLTVLVFVHEMGHYLVARWCGVAVETFSIGFGREVAHWHDAKGTRWRIGWLPLGGYVKFFGDADAASFKSLDSAGISAEERAQFFNEKPLMVRTAVVSAGPIANFLLSVVLLAGLFGIVGQPFTPPIIHQVLPDTAASAAGFEAGDRIVEIDGQSIDRFEEMQQLIMSSPGQSLVMIIARGERELQVDVTPGTRTLTDRFGNVHNVGYLGVQRSGVDFIRHDPLSAAWYAVKQTYNFTALTLRYVGQMIVGLRSADDLRGPIGIVQMSGQAAQIGITSVVQFMAVLSISLGLINLFPIPVLDGGHLLFYAYEAVRGKPLGERAQEYSFRVGLALVVGLMVMATWNDLIQLEVFDYVVRLFS